MQAKPTPPRPPESTNALTLCQEFFSLKMLCFFSRRWSKANAQDRKSWLRKLTTQYPLLQMRNNLSKNGFVSVWLGRQRGQTGSQLKLLLRDMRQWGWVQSHLLHFKLLLCCIPATAQQRPKALWAYLPWTDRHWLLCYSSQDTLPLRLEQKCLNTAIQNLSQMVTIPIAKNTGKMMLMMMIMGMGVTRGPPWQACDNKHSGLPGSLHTAHCTSYTKIECFIWTCTVYHSVKCNTAYRHRICKSQDGTKIVHSFCVFRCRVDGFLRAAKARSLVMSSPTSANGGRAAC